MLEIGSSQPQYTWSDSENECELFVLFRQVAAHGFDARAVGIRSAMAATRNVRQNEQIRGTGEAPRIDAEAMFLRQPMEAQIRYQRKYITAYDKHHFPAYLVRYQLPPLASHPFVGTVTSWLLQGRAGRTQRRFGWNSQERLDVAKLGGD